MRFFVCTFILMNLSFDMLESTETSSGFVDISLKAVGFCRQCSSSHCQRVLIQEPVQSEAKPVSCILRSTDMQKIRRGQHHNQRV